MEDLPGGGFFKPEDNLGRGRFATAAFAGQGEDFCWLDLKADIVHSCECDPGEHIALRVLFGQVVYLKQVIHVCLLQLPLVGHYVTSRQLCDVHPDK